MCSSGNASASHGKATVMQHANIPSFQKKLRKTIRKNLVEQCTRRMDKPASSCFQPLNTLSPTRARRRADERGFVYQSAAVAGRCRYPSPRQAALSSDQGPPEGCVRSPRDSALTRGQSVPAVPPLRSGSPGRTALPPQILSGRCGPNNDIVIGHRQLQPVCDCRSGEQCA